MKKLVLTQFGNPTESVTLTDVPEPTAGPGQVLVRVETAAINPSDELLIEGRYLVRPELPADVGAEGVGIVEAVGPEVDADLVGRRVILLPTFKIGTWAEKVAVDVDDVIEVPDADPLQLGMLTINPATAHLLLDDVADLHVGDWVGQTAANSAVGRLVIALAKRRGLRTLNVVRRADVADELRRAGGDVVLVNGPDLAEDIAHALGGDRLSLVIDPLGSTAATPLIRALRFRGTAVTYGSLIAPPAGPSTADLFAREVRYTGFWLGNWYSSASRAEIGATLTHLADLVAAGDLVVPVEETYRIDDYRKAFDHAATSARGGKVLFSFR